MNQCVLAIGAHPDDIEFYMGGTLLLLKRAGFELHYITIANGCYGSMQHDPATTAAIRLQEAKQAAARMGAIFHAPLTNDMEIIYDLPTLHRLAAVMREVAPKILLVHSPQDYMEDHMNASRLAVTAAFSRMMPYYPVNPPRMPVQQEVTIYHAQPHSSRDPMGQTVVPDLFVDVTSLIEEKSALVAEHQSQKDWLDKTQGMHAYIQTMKEMDAIVGRLSKRWTYAEGWRRHFHAGYCAADANPLLEALRPWISQTS